MIDCVLGDLDFFGMACGWAGPSDPSRMQVCFFFSPL